MTLLRYLHLLAMAFFVGGQMFLVAAVVPSLRDDDDRRRLRAIARRFGWGTLAAIVILIYWANGPGQRHVSQNGGGLRVLRRPPYPRYPQNGQSRQTRIRRWQRLHST